MQLEFDFERLTESIQTALTSKEVKEHFEEALSDAIGDLSFEAEAEEIAQSIDRLTEAILNLRDTISEAAGLRMVVKIRLGGGIKEGMICLKEQFFYV